MKHFYPILLAMVAWLVPSALSAESVNFIIDNPAAVQFTTYSSSLQLPDPVVEGVNTIEYNSSDYPSIQLVAQNGYRISAVNLNGENQLYEESASSFYLYLDESKDGNTYVVETYNLDEMRNATATVVVDNAARVWLGRNNDDYAVQLQDGENTVKFIEGTESPFTIRSNDYQPFYMVKVDGQDVQPNYGSYRVNVNDGSRIEIVTDFPDETHVLKLTVSEGCESFFSSLYDGNYNTIQGNVFEGIELQAGTQFVINFNTSSYKLDHFYVNGQETSIYSSYQGVIGTSDVELVADVHAFGTYNVVFNVDDPSRVNIWSGYGPYGDPFTLQAGENTISFTESSNQNYAYAEATSGNVITSVVRTNGDVEETITSTYFPVSAGDVFTITSSPKVRDQEVYFWVDPAAAESFAGVKFTDYKSDEITDCSEVHPGLNVLKFAASDMESYVYMSIQVKHPDPIPDNYSPWEPYVLADGLSMGSGTYFYFSYGELTPGTFIRVFAEQPEAHYLDFTLGNATTADQFVIDADSEAIEGWESQSVIAYKNTTVNVAWTGELNGDVPFSCEVDGESVEVSADGKCSFTVSDDHSVVLTAKTPTGITAVATDKVGDGAVYNLQGIRVADDASRLSTLPAGIYIVNGQKHFVK